MAMKEVCRDSRGNTLFVEDDEVGGKRYWLDEIGGGVQVWPTSLVSPEMMQLALQAEACPEGVVKPRWTALLPVPYSSQTGPYDIAIIDPPWPTANYSPKGFKKSPKYGMMGFPELMALGPLIRSMLAKNAIVFVWSTATHLSNAMVTIASWGLEYRSYRVWAKKGQSTGHWVRSNAEIVLLCTRGKPKGPVRGKQGRTTFEGAAWSRQHSAKPWVLHEWCEQHYPEAKKLELFARTTREGWDSFGSDLGTLITPDGIVRCSSTPASSTSERKSESEATTPTEGA